MKKEEYKKLIENQLMGFALSSPYKDSFDRQYDRQYARYHSLSTEEIILTAKAMEFIEGVVR